MDSMSMPLGTQQMAACQLGHILILLVKSMVLLRTITVMLVTLGMSLLATMVLQLSPLLIVRFLSPDQIPLLEGLLLFMWILMILERVAMNLARALEMLVVELHVELLAFRHNQPFSFL